METTTNHDHIIGWGVDADKSKRPAHQMWQPIESTGAHWKVPEQQPNFRDFYSMERPGPTHVFGSTVHPKGLSGLIRKFAFAKFSEGHWEHWILLMFADRINVFEGLIDDVLKGTRPHLLEERGWNVDKKFKTARYKKVIAFSAIAAVGVLYLLGRESNEKV